MPRATVSRTIAPNKKIMMRMTSTKRDVYKRQDPIPSTAGSLINLAVLAPPPIHGIGYAAPNMTANFGGDITITPKIISTTRFGYFFSNYHDFGYPTSGVDVVWGANGSGVNGLNGLPLPTGLQQGGGTATISSYDSTYTKFDASKHYHCLLYTSRCV